jgi:hypothetical protein
MQRIVSSHWSTFVNTCMVECTQLNMGFPTMGPPHKMLQCALIMVKVVPLGYGLGFRVYGFGVVTLWFRVVTSLRRACVRRL